MKHLENNCEGIDASVFSSDMLFDDERRNMLKSYIGRWVRAIEQHEKFEFEDEQHEDLAIPNSPAAFTEAQQPTEI
jgi:hypothetical protein